MPVHNTDIADIFSEVADLLEIEGANRFRVRAYREAARTIEGQSRSVREMLEKDEDLTRLSGIGEDLAGKIEEIVETGKLSQLEEIHQRLPSSLSEMMELAGLGPKKVKALYQELEISSLKGLEKAARSGKVRELKGFGEKTQQSILEEIEARTEGGPGRFKLARAAEFAAPLVEYLEKSKQVKEITVAGSYRRGKETVGDLDILVTCKRGSREKVMERFTGFEDVEKVVSRGKTKSTVILRSGLQVDLRAVAQVSYGAALLYFTGSKPHNIAVRKIGQGRKLKISEYGVFKGKGDGKKRVAGKTEKEVYESVDLPFIPPELREDRGEIEAARKGKLPDLITLDDIRGDLHLHTEESDGDYTAGEMAEAARERGYEYIAVTDHSRRLTVATGLDPERLKKQIKQIGKLNEKLEGFTVLTGIEVDIMEDGTLDLPDGILKELDLVVAAVHYKFDLPAGKQTDRILKALDNPQVNILDHPTTRLIGKRPPIEVNIEKIITAAIERGVVLELNAQPDRLDLNDVYCKFVKDNGGKIAVSTDSHRLTDLEFMRFGIGQARRGWLEAADVINTRKLKQLKEILTRK